MRADPGCAARWIALLATAGLTAFVSTAPLQHFEANQGPATPGRSAPSERDDRHIPTRRTSRDPLDGNRSFTTWITTTGVRVHDAKTTGAELLGLHLSRVHRGALQLAVPKGEGISQEGNRVEIARPALGLVEWYVNTPAGLEQGFTLTRRPLAEREEADGEPLTLELVLTGANARLRHDAVTLTSDAQRRFDFGKLFATDADGRVLASRFEVPAPNRIRILVDDFEANYPIVIDPLLTGSADTSIAFDWPGSQIGASVASAGDVNGDGHADVIVGAPFFSSGGAVSVLLGSATGVEATATSIQSSQVASEFGASVAAAGDVNGDGYGDVIVGAPRYDAGQADEGAAFVFLGSATGIAAGTEASAAARLEGDQTGSGLPGDLAARFGTSVASAGDVNGDGFDDVIVGAPGYDSGTADEGAAFVFVGSPSGVASGGPISAHARFESDQGRGQLFDRWPFFGASVAAAGDVNGDDYDDVIVGAPHYDAGEADEGAAFVFLGSASGPANGSPAAAHARFESDQAGAWLGASVAGGGDIDGDGNADVVVGAPSYSAGEAGEGAAFVFLGSASGISSGNPLTARAQLEADQTGSGSFGDFAPGLGTSVAFAGDVNDDGHDDWIVGSPYYDGSGAESGAVFVMLGSSGYAGAKRLLGPDDVDVHLDPGQGFSGFFGTRMGASVAGAGDVDADGFDDAIVGVPFYDTVFDTLPVEAGAAFVYQGSPSPPPCGIAPPAPVPGLYHRYSFCGDVSDSVGAAHGIVVDAGSTSNHAFVNGELDLSGNTGELSGEITEDAYVDLPNALLDPLIEFPITWSFSFELWFTVSETRTWQRLWDFGGGPQGEDTSSNYSASYIALTPNSSRRADGLELVSRIDGVERSTGISQLFPNGVRKHAVATFDYDDLTAGPWGTMRLYLDGVEAGTPEGIPSGLFHLPPIPAFPEFNNWLGRSQYAWDPVFDGSLDEFRIYAYALDPASVASSYLAGPEFLPEPEAGIAIFVGAAWLVFLRYGSSPPRARSRLLVVRREAEDPAPRSRLARFRRGREQRRPTGS